MAKYDINITAHDKNGVKVKDVKVKDKDLTDKNKHEDELIFDLLEDLPDGEYYWIFEFVEV